MLETWMRGGKLFPCFSVMIGGLPQFRQDTEPFPQMNEHMLS